MNRCEICNEVVPAALIPCTNCTAECCPTCSSPTTLCPDCDAAAEVATPAEVPELEGKPGDGEALLTGEPDAETEDALDEMNADFAAAEGD